MKKTQSPPEIVRGLLQPFKAVASEISGLHCRQENAETDLARLIESGDICDEKILDQIARLQLFVQLFPSRIAVREQAIDELKDPLAEALDNFTGNDIQIRFRDLTKAAYAKVELQLKAGFSDASQLRNAVDGSKLMGEVNSFWTLAHHIMAKMTSVHDPKAVIRCAEEFLKVWAAGEALEATI